MVGSLSLSYKAAQLQSLHISNSPTFLPRQSKVEQPPNEVCVFVFCFFHEKLNSWIVKFHKYLPDLQGGPRYVFVTSVCVLLSFGSLPGKPTHLAYIPTDWAQPGYWSCLPWKMALNKSSKFGGPVSRWGLWAQLLFFFRLLLRLWEDYSAELNQTG